VEINEHSVKCLDCEELFYTSEKGVFSEEIENLIFRLTSRQERRLGIISNRFCQKCYLIFIKHLIDTTKEYDIDIVNLETEETKHRRPESIDFNRITDLYYSRVFYGEEIFEGDLVEGKRQGRGLVQWGSMNGSYQLYEGEWNNDMKHGEGTYLWGDFGSYEGEWIDDMMHGQGVFEWQQIDDRGRSQSICHYTGQWKNHMKHGRGKFEWKNTWDGSIYEGNWKYDDIDGRLSVKRWDGNVFYTFWKNGEMISVETDHSLTDEELKKELLKLNELQDFLIFNSFRIYCSSNHDHIGRRPTRIELELIGKPIIED